MVCTAVRVMVCGAGPQLNVTVPPRPLFPKAAHLPKKMRLGAIRIKSAPTNRRCFAWPVKKATRPLRPAAAAAAAVQADGQDEAAQEIHRRIQAEHPGLAAPLES